MRIILKCFAKEVAYYKFAYYVAMSHLYHVSLKVLERSTTRLRRKSRLSHIQRQRNAYITMRRLIILVSLLLSRLRSIFENYCNRSAHCEIFTQVCYPFPFPLVENSTRIYRPTTNDIPRVLKREHRHGCREKRKRNFNLLSSVHRFRREFACSVVRNKINGA